MGLNDEGVSRGALVFDVEAAPIENVEEYLDEPTPPANYTKLETIAAWKVRARQEQIAKASLDIDLARVVAIGIEHAGVCRVETLQASSEIEMLHWFWSYMGSITPTHLVGYNVIGYDLPLLLRRSLYLGVKAPAISLNKYRHPDVDDLMYALSFDGAFKFRPMSFYLKRFGIPHDDPIKGEDIPGLVAAGNWQAVADHCRKDVEATAALARRLGYLR